MIKKIIYILTVFYISCIGLYASDFNGEKLLISTIERKPFSYIENGRWTGFSIELFEKVAKKNNLQYEYESFDDFTQMLESIKYKQNDIAVANISITLEREKYFDFSAPIYDSGLNILSLIKNPKIISFTSKYGLSITYGILILFFGFILLIHFFWLKSFIKGNLFISDYLGDILEISGSIIEQCKNTFGTRILIAVIIVLSVLIVTFFSEKVTLMLNQQEKKNQGNLYKITYSSITNKDIGVTRNSTAMSFLNSNNIETKNYNILNNLYIDLEKEVLDYVVADEPILRYYSKSSQLKIYDVVGKTFNHESFGFLLKNDSDLLEKINVSILELKENGYYDTLYKQYFD